MNCSDPRGQQTWSGSSVREPVSSCVYIRSCCLWSLLSLWKWSEMLVVWDHVIRFDLIRLSCQNNKNTAVKWFSYLQFEMFFFSSIRTETAGDPEEEPGPGPDVWGCFSQVAASWTKHTGESVSLSLHTWEIKCCFYWPLTWITSSSLSSQPPTETQVVISAEGQQLHLHLEKNEWVLSQNSLISSDLPAGYAVSS